jgi:hypothetical protein
MSKLIDPRICPDCRAQLGPDATCTGCGLRLVGPAAAELWQRMQEADRLVEQLRAAAPALVRTAPLPHAPAAAPAPPPARRLPSASVPAVLLGLGALCLLVAAVVFVAVAWSSLGLGAKTTILLAVTSLFASGAVLLTRRDLRFAAETFWLIVAGMVILDITAAWSADLLGLRSLDGRHAVGLTGAALLAIAIGAGAWATTTALGRVHCLVGVAGIGAVLLTAGEAWTVGDGPLATAISVPLLAGTSFVVARLVGGALRPTAYAVAAVGALSWLGLVGSGVNRMSDTEDLQTWWSELTGWPLLVAALFAAVLTLRPFPTWVRMTGASASLATLALFVVGPGADATVEVLVLAGLAGVLAVLSATAPRVWSVPAAAFTALGLLTSATWVLVRPLDVALRLPTNASPDHAELGLRLPGVDGGPAAWTAIVTALVVGACAAGLLRHLAPARREAAGRAFIALGPGALALGAASALLETEPTLLVALLAWSATLALAAAMTVTVSDHTAPLVASLVFAAYLVAVDLRIAVASHLLAAVLATVVALVLALAYSRVRAGLLNGLLMPLLAGSAVLGAGFAATHWPYVVDGTRNAIGLTLVLVASAALLAARPAGRGEDSRRTIETVAFLCGVVAAAFPTEQGMVAMVVTILGSAVALVTVLNDDRDELAWLGVVVLGVATLIRVADDVSAPEVYTLPAAMLLVGAGWWRLRSDPAAGSARALSSGLTLALVPSLLLALDEPVSVRGAVVGAAGLLVLAVGIVQHWSAPLAAGAATTGVLALRHLGPVADALPRWISLGSVGLALLLVGVTWESRRRDLAATSRYLAALR